MNRHPRPVVGGAKLRLFLTHRIRFPGFATPGNGVFRVILLFLLLPVLPIRAQTESYWVNPGAGLWSEPGNWSAGIPDPTSNAMIQNGTATVTVGIDAVPYDVFLGSIAPSLAGFLSVEGGSLTTREMVFYQGFLTQTGGTISNEITRLGSSSGTWGNATISGGTWTNSSLLEMRAADLTIEGTGRVISPEVRMEYSVSSPAPRLFLSGGTLTTGNVEATGSGSTKSVWFNGGRLQLSQDQATLFSGFDSISVFEGGGTIDTQGFAVASNVKWLNAGVEIPGAMTKTGSGTLTLTGTYLSQDIAIVVSEGRLQMDRFASSDISVQSGAVLGGGGGTGDITLESGAILAPGGDLGTLTAESLQWEAGAVLQFDLGDASADLLSLGGLLDKSSSGAFAFEFLDEGWQVGQTYDLIHFTGTDFQQTDFSFSNGNGFRGDFTLSGDRLQFELTAVPEPSTWTLLTIGLLLGIVARRRVD